MVTGFDLWSHDGRLRRHWGNRALAFVIDSALFIPVLLVLWFGGIDDVYLIGSISSVLFFTISYLEEVTMKATVGKLVVGLRVKAIKEGAFTLKALVRNVNRLMWFVLPLLDFALGMATRGDPRQRALDRLAGTTVIDLSETDWHEGHLREYDPQEKKEVGHDDRPSPMVTEGSVERCHECSGPLIQLADENYQCQDCGLIQ